LLHHHCRPTDRLYLACSLAVCSLPVYGCKVPLPYNGIP
jgi:hypothetical protein